jgi:hypothetical protein
MKLSGSYWKNGIQEAKIIKIVMRRVVKGRVRIPVSSLLQDFTGELKLGV